MNEQKRLLRYAAAFFVRFRRCYLTFAWTDRLSCYLTSARTDRLPCYLTFARTDRLSCYLTSAWTVRSSGRAAMDAPGTEKDGIPSLPQKTFPT